MERVTYNLLISCGVVVLTASCGTRPNPTWRSDAELDIDADRDFDADSEVPPQCEGDLFECRPNGSARICTDGQWTGLGRCPLGCDVERRECLIVSNDRSHRFETDAWRLDLAGYEPPITVNTDTGEIRDRLSVIRAAGTGTDEALGISYEQDLQDDVDIGLGVFSLGDLNVPEGVEVVGVGSRALVLLVSGEVTIDGVINVRGRAVEPGPGGFAGGVGSDGEGPCAGAIGEGANEGTPCCSGSGGGGHVGLGGAGGNCSCGEPYGYEGGLAGGDICGEPELIPLVGGSGGSGGPMIEDMPSNAPGGGGGGGGALQISASEAITLNDRGGINAGGGGGGETIDAGGAGGGAGGSILLESPLVTVAVGAVLAANGGGGGGGDCT